MISVESLPVTSVSDSLTHDGCTPSVRSYPALLEISNNHSPYWTITGHGNRGDSCGKWVMSAWCDCTVNLDGRVTGKVIRNRCRDRGCPDHEIDGVKRVGCGRDWVRSYGTRVTIGLQQLVSEREVVRNQELSDKGYTSRRHLGVYHVIISLRKSAVVRDKVSELRDRRKAFRILKNHVVGAVGVCVVHPYRTVKESDDGDDFVKGRYRGYDYDGIWDGKTPLRDGVHYHFTVVGDVSVPYSEELDGDSFVKVIFKGYGEGVRWGAVSDLVHYELGHAGWSGVRSHAVFPVGRFTVSDDGEDDECDQDVSDDDGDARCNCPFCHHPWKSKVELERYMRNEAPPWGTPWGVKGHFENGEPPPSRYWRWVRVEDDGNYTVSD